MANVTATVLCMPITIERVRSTSVDGIINGVEVQGFIDDFSSQTKNQITLVSTLSVSRTRNPSFSLPCQAGVSMALDIAILAIPGLGTTTIVQTLCSCSFLLGVGCIFAGTMVQHFCERMRSLDFAVRIFHTPSIQV
jgi:hypothetical protein